MNRGSEAPTTARATGLGSLLARDGGSNPRARGHSRQEEAWTARGTSLEFPGRAGQTPAAGSSGQLPREGRGSRALCPRGGVGPGAGRAPPPSGNDSARPRRARPAARAAGGALRSRGLGGPAAPSRRPPLPAPRGDPAPPASPGRSSRPPSRRLHHSARSPCCRM